MLEAYREHVAERAAQNIPPKPLNAEQVAGLIELLKNPPADEGDYLLDLISNRVPPGVDEAAYVKAGFLSAIARSEVACPLIDKVLAVNDDLPIRTDKPVHSGKVRSVYWLSAADSARLIHELKDGRAPRYEFSHALIRQTLYEELYRHLSAAWVADG